MEEDNFINLLVKNLQMLCHDHLPFKQSLEVTGHVCIHIDSGLNLNLFLNEKCNKVNTSSVFSSLSFQAPSSLPTDINLTESTDKQPVPAKGSVFVQKNFNKRLFSDGNVDSSIPKTIDFKKIGKPNYNKLSSQTSSSIIVPVKKVQKSNAEKLDENDDTAVAVVQEKPFIQHLSSEVIVKQEQPTLPTESDIEKFGPGNQADPVKDEVLIEALVDEDGDHMVEVNVHKAFQDENNIEHEERIQPDTVHKDTMIDETEEIPEKIHNDDDGNDDNDDDEKTTDHDYGETSITHNEEDYRIPEITEVNNYLDQKELDDGIEYTIVDMATKKGRPMLIDSVGFGYNIRRNTDKTVHWTCSLRNKQICCAAGVLQCNDSFTRNKHQHCHPPKPGLLTSTIIVAEARAQASNDPVTPTSLVVQRAMTVKGKSEDETFLPRSSNLKRMINRYRQCKREGGLPKKKARIDFVKFEALENESQ